VWREEEVEALAALAANASVAFQSAKLYERVALERDIGIAVARSFVQLTAIGYVIKLVFEQDDMLFVVALLTVMVVFGAITANSRAKRVPGAFWPLLIALALAGVAVGVMSEVLVDSISEASHSIGLSEFFIGAIVVAIVGNAAEHWVAVVVARKRMMDLSVNIAIGSSAQVALFVTPVLVLAAFFIGPAPLPLVFNGYEIGALLLAVLIANYVTQEGESTWFEGVQLLAVYAMLALVFAFA
jgi:calcium/proton exchanger cax